MVNKDTFCSYPFQSLFLETGGEVKPCCAMEGSLGNIKTTPLKDIMEGKLATEIRESISNGKWHPACIDCKVSESKGMESQRSSSLHKFDEMKDIIHPEYFKLNDTDIRWSNTCNLSCTYCDSHFSSQWAKVKDDRVWIQPKSAPEQLIEYLEEHRETYKEANLLGGEPLLLKPNLKLAETFPDIKFNVLSNLMAPLETNKIAQKLLELPNVQWQVSFETIGKRFEYVRHNGDWNVFQSNLKYIYERAGQLKAFPTYCVYSALSLYEFCDYIYSTEYFDDYIWTGLVYPKELDITLQTPFIKQRAIEEIDKVFYKYGDIPQLKEFRRALEKRLSEPGADYTDYHHNIDRMLGKDVVTEDLWPELIR